MAEAIYGMNYSNFIGVDRSSDPRVVARNRLAYSVNMWRDYESEQGAAIETFPGFRRVAELNDDSYIINGMHHYKGKKHEYILIHKYDKLYVYNVTSGEMESEPIYAGLNPNEATVFAINNRLYFVSDANGKSYKAKMVAVSENENGDITAGEVSEYYTPTTYYNGQPYEQKNAFSSKVTQVDTTGGIDYHTGDSYREFILYDSYTAEKVIKYDPAGIADPVTVPKETGIESVYVDSITKLEELDLGTAIGQTDIAYAYKYKVTEEGCLITSIIVPKSIIYDEETGRYKTITIKRKVDAINFNTIGDLREFQNDKVTMAAAILGCTKSAVYDGRVFLTGNPELPNTVFYSQRNLTGANDPTYFGVYNYFNDGDGNTPNVDMLAMPNMLMVIKGDTVQDGSIYYHVGADNPHSDKSVRDLVPRIYPSSTGAAGLGSAGDTLAYSLSCNFLDDPVFLSRRGLEGVTKEQLNAERTVQHRSSTIDRLLIQEDLAHASLAEWKGYLVICCNGHIYLADSRTRTQNAYGSYQYEWFYLEDVGTYEEYTDAYFYTSSEIEVYAENGSPVRLKDIIFNYNAADSSYNTYTDLGFTDEREDRIVGVNEVVKETWGYNNWNQLSAVKIRYVEEGNKKFPVQTTANVKYGGGEFYGAKRVLAVGELLFFATDYDICVFNTDKRGEQIYLKDDSGKDVFDEKGKRILVREVDGDKIDSSWYSFNGVPYISGCSIRLDDCEKKTVTKANVYGTTVARFKMIPGSKCTVKSSINGVNWKKIGEAFISRFNFEDFRFDNTAFTENEDGVFVFPEVSRGWVSKQYYFYSDGFCEPFGLYELSYNYKIVGKIRR